MVPGSTFRYGSNFWHVTFSPRLSSRQPMDAAAMPLPRDETTPPVTKMNLAIHAPPARRSRRRNCLEHLRHTLQIGGRIYSQGLVFRFHHADPEPVFQRTQLLQPLRLFQ